MKKITAAIIFTISFASSLSFGATLQSMSKQQIKQSILNKTFTSIATDNLNGRTIDNTFSMYLDNHGNIWGKMAHKPTNEPIADKGLYSIQNDGTVFITWQHWDGGKKLCAHLYNTKNAYISIDCAGVFHTVFMKEATHSGNNLN